MAPKSNAVYKAFNEAKALIKQDGTRPVPMHLRNAPTKLMKDLDYGKDYRYAHDEEGGFAAGENYFPEGMRAAGVLSAGRARAWRSASRRSCASCEKLNNQKK